jgi:glycosyltransferase involved in cell wall biosynthesis
MHGMPAAAQAVFINGKFTAQRTTGVQRVAEQLVLAMDTLLAPAAGQAWPALRPVLLVPPGGRPPPLRHLAVQVLAGGAGRLHAWEQWTLPRAVGGALLLNLSGSAPARAARQMALLHDAAVFDAPQAYTRAFVGWYRWLFRRLGQRALALFTVSAFSRSRLAACLGLAPARLQVIHPGADHLQHVAADTGVLQRHGLQPGRYFLAVGSRNPNKNLAALVQAFGRMPPQPGLKLALAGGDDPGVFAAARHGAGGPGAAADVVHLGPVDDAGLKALYGQALALVFPSLYEGWGLPPLEAMACGCPVAVSAVASLPEACGDAALYFDPHDGAALTAALQRLALEPALRERLRRAGAAQAARRSWQAPAAELLGALQRHAAPGAQP